MTEMDQLLWRAIEGALGTEKRAFLQNAPLTEIIGSNASFELSDAMGAVAASGAQKHAEAASIRSGLQALALVADAADVGRPEPFTQKVARAYQLRVLEPYCSGGTKQAAIRERRRLNAEIMETVKTAGAGTALAGTVSNPLLRETGKKMLQGLGAGIGAGAGLALPAYGVGSMLSDKFTEDARNRALQTAGGVAGIGALGYGAKTLMDQMAQDRSRTKNYEAMHDFHKRSSVKVAAEVYASMHVGMEKAAHMATCVYLDECLSSLEQTHKVAGLRDLNNEFLTELLATTEKSANVMQRLRRVLGAGGEESAGAMQRLLNLPRINRAPSFLEGQREQLLNLARHGEMPMAKMSPKELFQGQQRYNLQSLVGGTEFT